MKKFSVLSVSIIVFGLCTCVSCGYLISTALLTTGLFETSSTIQGEKQNVYAIVMAESKDINDLNEQKTQLQMNDGAGYIYSKDENFYLLASLYENQNDAELVKNNLKTNNIDCSILKVELPIQTIEGHFSTNEKSSLTESLKSSFSTFKSLYDTAISLDTKVFDKTQAKLQCNTIFSNQLTLKTNFETLFDVKATTFKQLYNQLNQTNTHLLLLINEIYESPTQTYSSLIKLTYCKILLD